LSAALLLLALVFAIALAGCDLFPDEPPPPPPDWTPQDAEFITLTEGVWADGDIPSSYGEQWFKFTATAETQYIHVIFGTLTDLAVQLYDNKGKTVSSSARLDSYGDSHISRTVTSGKTYYIEVRPYYAYSGKGTYQIAFNTSSTRPDGTWTPGADVVVMPLTEGVWADGNIASPSGEQWFSFTAISSYSHYIHALFGTMTDLWVSVYDSNGNTVGTEKDNLFDSSYSYTHYTYRSSLTSGQKYYIKIWPYTGYSGTYQIAFNTSSTRPSGNWTPSADYTTLTASVWANGNIATATGEQWFRFTAASSSHYIHVTLGTLTNLAVQLYDSFGSTVGTSSNFTTTSYESRSSLTSGQIYYIKVQPNSGTGTYQIAFNTSFSNSSIITWPPTPPVTPLPIANQWVSGNIATSSGEQWFSFTATASPQWIHVTFGTLTDFYVQLHNSNGTTVGTRTEMWSSIRSTSRSVTSGQIYYISVKPYSGSGTYHITFNTSSSRPADP
jgi:hypothetical protein